MFLLALPLPSQEVSAGLPWLEVLALLVLGGIAVLAWLILQRLRAPSALARIEERLGEMRADLSRLGEGRAGLDLRRVEHVLLDLREAHKRLEERLIQMVESARASSQGPSEGPGPAPVSERVVNRLLSMGYERIQILTPPDELAAVFEQGGEVLVEARQGGAVCKGRVRVRDGAIVDAELRSAHAMFP